MDAVHKAGQRLSGLVVDGPLRPLGRPLVRGAIAGELAAVSFVDWLSRSNSPAGSVDLGAHLTAVIKTFERPRLLHRLVDSIRRTTPSLSLVIVDDSRDPVDIEGVDLVKLPYDSGVSAGRSAGLDRVRTEYVLMLDDDHVFYRRTNLWPTLGLMADHPEIDIVGGAVVNLPTFHTHNYGAEELFPTDVTPVVPLGTRIAGLPVYDKVASFFVGRSDRVRQVNWDPRLKRMEHADFFTRARGVLTTVFNADLRCLHAQDRFDAAYMAKRLDLAADRTLLGHRWYPRSES